MSEIDTRRSDRTKASTAAIVASVVACRPGRSLSTMLSLPRANFVHQKCIAGSDVNKDWTCKDKDKDQAYKDQDKDFTYSYLL